jgi:hypothetical protein
MKKCSIRELRKQRSRFAPRHISPSIIRESNGRFNVGCLDCECKAIFEPVAPAGAVFACGNHAGAITDLLRTENRRKMRGSTNDYSSSQLQRPKEESSSSRETRKPPRDDGS